ncbi:UNVERIFIED_CONTAM: hypothetical protein GTU68_033728 [Idotea baltica]|nr:hypothetical protein [Idotea baltica]MCL4138966.1 hypothetical protein [Idotea baltica]
MTFGEIWNWSVLRESFWPTSDWLLRTLKKRRWSSKRTSSSSSRRRRKMIEQERYSPRADGRLHGVQTCFNAKIASAWQRAPRHWSREAEAMANSLQLLHCEKDVDDDLKMINKSKLVNVKKTSSTFAGPVDPVSNDPRIENGKLFFDKKWFYKGQSVLIECKDGTRFTAELVVTSGDVIIVRKVPENTRVRITLAQLAHGKYLVKRKN